MLLGSKLRIFLHVDIWSIGGYQALDFVIMLNTPRLRASILISPRLFKHFLALHYILLVSWASWYPLFEIFSTRDLYNRLQYATIT